MKRILITGATGHFGRDAIDHLLKQNFPAENISALVRDASKAGDLEEKGVDVRIGNYDDYDSLVKAFEGVDKLLFVSGSDVEKRVQQHQKVVKAAVEAGVKRIHYTSFERRNETEDSPIAAVAKAHMQTEQQLKESPVSYTIFRNNIYIDMIPLFAGERVREDGIFLPAGDTGVAFALRRDMAEAAANVLTGDDHKNTEYYFSNVENVSFPEIAEMLSEITGQEIRYTDPEPQVFIDTLKKAGVPGPVVHMSAGFAEGMKQGEFKTDRSDLAKLLGRKPTSVKEYLQSVYS